jgi:putative addiction module CopG family antidote
MVTAALKLPATLEKFVSSQVEQGAYRSRQAAIVAAVASEKRRAEQRAWLKTEIRKGLDSGTAGPLNMEDVNRRGRGRSARRLRSPVRLYCKE